MSFLLIVRMMKFTYVEGKKTAKNLNHSGVSHTSIKQLLGTKYIRSGKSISNKDKASDFRKLTFQQREARKQEEANIPRSGISM